MLSFILRENYGNPLSIPYSTEWQHTNSAYSTNELALETFGHQCSHKSPINARDLEKLSLQYFLFPVLRVEQHHACCIGSISVHVRYAQGLDLAQVQHRLVYHWVGPVVPQVVQVVVKVNQLFVGAAFKQGRSDLLGLTPILKAVSETHRTQRLLVGLGD